MDWSFQQSPKEPTRKPEADRRLEKEVFQRMEWFGRLTRFRNDALVLISIICLQLPFELAYAHTYVVMKSDIMK